MLVAVGLWRCMFQHTNLLNARRCFCKQFRFSFCCVQIYASKYIEKNRHSVAFFFSLRCFSCYFHLFAFCVQFFSLSLVWIYFSFLINLFAFFFVFSTQLVGCSCNEFRVFIALGSACANVDTAGVRYHWYNQFLYGRMVV